MIAVIQRVTKGAVSIDNTLHSGISQGLVILVGIESSDLTDDVDWLCKKIVNLRIFNDEKGVMNLNVNAIHGEVLVVSQFTLQASTKKGNRPSYVKAAKPETAIPLYQQFIDTLGRLCDRHVQTGVFGADMQLSLTNDGPVTIIMNSKNKV